jgi:hypothetical protein
LAIGAVNTNPALATNPDALTATVTQCTTSLTAQILASGAISAAAATKLDQCDEQAALAACQQQLLAAAQEGDRRRR